MSRLLWLAAGLVLGVGIGRNAAPYGQAAGSAVVLGLVLACCVYWMAARRAKVEAVATAVASAVAVAHVEFEAQLAAQAHALAQVNVYGQPSLWAAAGDTAGGASVSAPLPFAAPPPAVPASALREFSSTPATFAIEQPCE